MNSKDLMMIIVVILVPGGMFAGGFYFWRRIRAMGWAFAPNMHPYRAVVPWLRRRED